MDAAEWRRNVRLSVIEGALATAMGSLMSGVVLMGFALSLGASRLTIGILAALPSLANVAQLLGARWLSAGVHRKRFCIGASTISRALWISVLAVPLLGAGYEKLALAGLIVLVAISSVLSSLGGVAWLSWIRDLVPAEKRLGFLALRNQFDTALALTLGVAGAAFIDWWNAGNPAATGGFVCVLAVAMACGLIGIPILNRMHHPESKAIKAVTSTTTRPRPSLRHAAPPLRERNFRNLILFYISWNLAVHLANPFFAVFMLQKLGLPFWKITALQALFSIAALAANPFWTRLGRRIGTRPVVFLATACDAFYPLCWFFLTPESSWALPLIFLFGIFNTPLAVGAPTLVMRLAPEENASSYLATFNAIIGVVMGAAAILGGYLAGLTHSATINIGVATIGGLQLIFLLSAVGRMASLWILHKVQEPGELPLRQLLPQRARSAVALQPATLAEDATLAMPAPAMLPLETAA
jgi:MFS family permease